MTSQPKKFKDPSSNSASAEIELTWNYYDDEWIEQLQREGIRANLAEGSNIKNRLLPFINNLHLDISGEWVNTNDSTDKISVPKTNFFIGNGNSQNLTSNVIFDSSFDSNEVVNP